MRDEVLLRITGAGLWGLAAFCWLLTFAVGCACSEEPEVKAPRSGPAGQLVEESLRCRPRLAGRCSRKSEVEERDGRTHHWVRSLGTFPGEGQIEAIVAQAADGQPRELHIPYVYGVDEQGEVSAARCVAELPQAGMPLEQVRAPDRVEADGLLIYRDVCESVDELVEVGFFVKDGKLVEGYPYFPAQDRPCGFGWSHVFLHMQGFPEAFSRVPAGAIRVSALHALGSSSQFHGSRRCATSSWAEGVGLQALDCDEGWARVYEESEQPPREPPAERLYQRNWLLDALASGESEGKALELGSSLQKKAVLLGDDSELRAEVSGVTVALQAYRQGAWFEFEEDPSLNAGWAALSAALQRQGWEDAILWSAPYALAGEHLYRVEGEGAALLCSSLQTSPLCLGECSRVSEANAAYQGGQLFFPFVGGVLVGSCLDEEEAR